MGGGGEAEGAVVVVNMVDAFCWYSADAARFGATLGDGEDNAAGNRTPMRSAYRW